MYFSHPNRRLHLIDIENLAGSSCPDEGLCRAVSDAYFDLDLVGPSDLLVVGCCHRVFSTAAYGFGGARYVVASGKDGADRALLSLCDEAGGFERRFDGIVIGSGDHIFVDLALAARRSSLDVEVVSRYGHISIGLRSIAHRVRFLEVASKANIAA